MALTHICFCKLGVRANNSDVPAIDGESMVSSGITPSASNQQSSASPSDGSGPFARVATDTAIYYDTNFTAHCADLGLQRIVEVPGS